MIETVVTPTEDGCSYLNALARQGYDLEFMLQNLLLRDGYEYNWVMENWAEAGGHYHAYCAELLRQSGFSDWSFLAGINPVAYLVGVFLVSVAMGMLLGGRR